MHGGNDQLRKGFKSLLTGRLDETPEAGRSVPILPFLQVDIVSLVHQFCVLVNSRFTDADKDVIIREVAQGVDKKHYADLTFADETLIVEVIKHVYMITILDDWLIQRKYNVQQLASLGGPMTAEEITQLREKAHAKRPKKDITILEDE